MLTLLLLPIGICLGQHSGSGIAQLERTEMADIRANGPGYRLVLPGAKANSSPPSTMTITADPNGARSYEEEFPMDHIHHSGIAVDIWGDSSVHRFTGTFRFPEQDLVIFASGPQEQRLTFCLLHDLGYVYLRGIGTVVLGGDTIVIGSDEDGKNVHWTHEVPGLYSKLLVKAAGTDDLQLFKHLFKNGGDVDTYTAKRVWLPDDLMARKQYALIALLIERPKYKEHYATNLTVSHEEAMETGDEQLFKLLLAMGLDPDLQTANGASLLHEAAEKGQDDIVKILIGAGAEIEIEDANGKTVVQVASAAKNVSLVEQLIQLGANIDHKDKEGRTVLMEAVLVRDVKLVEFLLESGADPTVVDGSGRSAMTHAIEQSDLAIYNMLRADGSSKSVSTGKPNIIAALAKPNVFEYMLLNNTESKRVRYEGRSLRNLARRQRTTKALMRMDNRFHWQVRGAFQLNFFKSDLLKIKSSVGGGFQLFTRLQKRIELVTGYYYTRYNFGIRDPFSGKVTEYGFTLPSNEYSVGLQWNSTDHVDLGSMDLYLQFGYTLRQFDQGGSEPPFGFDPITPSSEDAVYAAYGFGDRGRSRFFMEFRYTYGVMNLIQGSDAHLHSLTVLSLAWGM